MSGFNPVNSRESGFARLKKPTAIFSAFVLSVGGVFLGQSLQAPLATAADFQVPGLANKGFDPDWTKLDGVTANWKEALGTEDSVYWTSDLSTGNSLTPGQEIPMLGESYDFNDDATEFKTRMAMSFTTTGAAPFGSFLQFSTQAMAPMGGTSSGNETLSMYFWSHDGADYVNQIDCGTSTGLGALQTIEVVRVTDGDPNVYGGCMPAPPMGIGTGWSGTSSDGFATGGEGNQITGRIYVQADYGYLDSVQAPLGTGPNTNWVQFQVWDPVTGESSWSGPIQPADTLGAAGQVSSERARLQAIIDADCKTGLEGPTACTYGPAGVGNPGTGVEAAADFGMDAQGNMFMFVSAPIIGESDGAASLVRISPARDDDGNFLNGSQSQPWTYNVVRKLHSDNPNIVMDQSAIWSPGTGIMNGHFLAGGYINVYDSTAAYGSTTGPNLGAAPTLNTSISGTASRMMAIDPLAGTMKISTSTENENPALSSAIGRIYRDNASQQMLTVISGRVVNDVNGNGEYEDDEPGIQGVELPIYDENNVLMGIALTAADGRYDAIVPAEGTFQVRVSQPRINGVNAAMTWGEVNADQNDAIIHCLRGDIQYGHGTCYGALDRPYYAPMYGEVGEQGDNSQWPYYATVTMVTDEEVPEVNFGFTTYGSYGDSASGPATVTAGAPVHVNGIQPSLWMGDALGSYSGPDTKDAHVDTDDGVFVKTNAGALLPMDDQLLAASHAYNLSATLSGDRADEAFVTGWTSTSPNASSWNATAKWTPTNNGTSAEGSFQYGTNIRVNGTPTVPFRANASLVEITAPTNADNQYQAQTGDTTVPWVTSGEIEDYQVRLATAVLRPAVLNAGDSATFQVRAGNNTQSLTAGRNDAVVYGSPAALSLSSGTTSTTTVSSTAPAGAVFRSVTAKDTTTGAAVPVTTPTVNGSTVSADVTYGVGSDITVQFNYGAQPDASKSTLTLDPVSGTAVVSGAGVEAIATIVDKDGQPVEGYVVNFTQKSADVTASANTCTTDDQGVCSITVNSAKPGVYTDQVAATVNIGGTDTAVSGSPKSVTFTAGEFSYSKSTFTVDPVVSATDAAKTNWVAVSDGSAYYTGTLTAMDDAENRLSDLTLSDISFMSNSGQVVITSVVNEGNGVYTVHYSSKKAATGTQATLTYDGKAVGSALPIPFKAGAFNPDPTCSDPTLTGSNLKADPASVMVGGSSSIKAHATDEFCNPLPDTTVSFGLVGSSDATISANTAVTDANGYASVTVTDSTVESVDVAGSVDGTAFKESPVTVDFTAEPIGDVDPAHSTFTVSPTADPADAGKTNWQVADGVAYYTGTFTAHDSKDRGITGLGKDSMLFGTNASASILKVTDWTEVGDGVYTVHYSTTRADSSYLANAVKYTNRDGDVLTIGSNKPVPFKAGAFDPDPPACEDPDLTGSNISADPMSVTVGGESTITGHATDTNCNPIEDATVTFSLGGGTDASLSRLTAQTNADGDATVTLTDATVETVPVHGVVDGKEFGNSPVEVDFVAKAVGDVDPSKSTFVVTPKVDPADVSMDGWKVADGDQFYTGTFTARDSNDQAVTGLDADSMVFGTNAKVISVSAVDEVDPGVYEVEYSTIRSDSSYLANAVKYTNKDGDVLSIGSAQPIPFQAGEFDPDPTCSDPSLTASNLSAAPTTVTVGGESTITAHATDENCNPIIGATVDFGLESGSDAELSDASAVTDDNGDAIITVTDETAEEVGVTGEVDGTPFK
ncbi:MAG: Ig-like domain-containing protein, partial [Propionibacteriaceae bacterium]|nr:Ig-like domain-containing protein [Propionibacteriaceae bacterium]